MNLPLQIKYSFHKINNVMQIKRTSNNPQIQTPLQEMTRIEQLTNWSLLLK